MCILNRSADIPTNNDTMHIEHWSSAMASHDEAKYFQPLSMRVIVCASKRALSVCWCMSSARGKTKSKQLRTPLQSVNVSWPTQWHHAYGLERTRSRYWSLHRRASRMKVLKLKN